MSVSDCCWHCQDTVLAADCQRMLSIYLLPITRMPQSTCCKLRFIQLVTLSLFLSLSTVHCYTCCRRPHSLKVKVHTFDIAPLRSESPPQKRSGMACVLKGFHSFTCTPTGSSTIGMSHTCLCLPSCSSYSFTDPGGMEG